MRRERLPPLPREGQGAMSNPKIIQLVVSGSCLYALDSNGDIYQFHSKDLTGWHKVKGPLDG